MFNVNQVFNQMSLKEKIAQMFLQYYQGYDDLPEHLKELNRKNLLGGVIFFSGNNVRDIEQLHNMNKKIQSYASENKYNLPFFLTIDQEGGQLTAIHRGTTIFPGNMSLGFANDVSLAYEQGRHVGRELRYAGINICYAPVLDVDYDAHSGIPIVDNRRYSTVPKVVAKMSTAYINGLQDEGILACGKHFPGMRITEVDTHHQMDVSPYDMKRLESVEILPFKQAIDEGLKCIMTHHGIFSAMDNEMPASLSKKILNYLREVLGFEGLVITDDLIMKAILDQYGEKESIMYAINAGVDLIISTCAGDWFVDYVHDCVMEGKISEGRINDSVKRILEYKKASDAGNITEERGFSMKEGNELSKKIAHKGLVLYKGEQSDFPIRIKETDHIGIIFGNPARLVMSDATNLYEGISFKEILTKKGCRYVKEVIMPWHPTDEEIISLVDVAIISDIVIFTTVNGYRFDRQLKVLEEIRKYCPNKTIISIATRSPNDAVYLERSSDYVIVTGGLTTSILEALYDTVFGSIQFEYNPAKQLGYQEDNNGKVDG